MNEVIFFFKRLFFDFNFLKEEEDPNPSFFSIKIFFSRENLMIFIFYRVKIKRIEPPFTDK